MVIDMDKTIAKLLIKYYKYIDILIEHEKQNVMKIKDDAEFEKAKSQYLKLIDAENFVKLIAADPKKYLYHPLDIVFIKIDEKNKPHLFYDVSCKLPSICDKVKPIRELLDKNVNWHVLDMLSAYISGYVRKYGTRSQWLYYGNKYTDHRAHYILEINKYVNLLLSKNFVKIFKNKMPLEYFAEKHIELGR